MLQLLTHLRELDEAKLEDMLCAWNLEWRCVGGERHFVLAEALDFVDVVLDIYPRRPRRSA